MKSTQSKFIYASALVLSFAFAAGTAEAGNKRAKHHWDIHPAAYAPDGLGDYGTESVNVEVNKAKKNARKISANRTAKKLGKSRYDWLSNPEAYAPDGLGDYGTVAVQSMSKSRPVAFSNKAKAASRSKYDWQVNPAAYAPDGLGDYGDMLNAGKFAIGMVRVDRNTAPSA